MSTNTTAANGSVAANNGVASRRSAAPLPPPVDISENSEGITLTADLPGVSKENLHVHVEANNLLIEGTSSIDVPAGTQALHTDVRSTAYRRRFVLSRELETGKIEASLKDGVLTVRIPKRAELRPRRIEVQAS
jgi:HSP20 family molecular chaperone IbpA